MKDRGEVLTHCPEKGHGRLLDVDGRAWCPHQSHDGRPKSHPDGYAPPTRSWF